MQNTSCCSCLSSKAPLVCGLCKESVCKSCAQFLDESSFAFIKKKPEVISHTTYCPACFDNNVAAELQKYNDDLEKARNIAVFDKAQAKETRNFKRFNETYSVRECPDREETLLRLAFQAVRSGFNAIIEVEISSKKVRESSRQRTIYSGLAQAAMVNESKRFK